MKIKFILNGKNAKAYIDPATMLIDMLRDKGMMSVKRGCDTSNCGLCTVWIDNMPALSCSVLAATIDGKAITTLEGMQDEAAKVGKLLGTEGADQCGFCSPGLIMNVIAMKRDMKEPTEDKINKYLAGNLCRCTGYQGQLRAIKQYMEAK